MSDYLAPLWTAIATGAGSAIGAYLANKSLIKQLEKILEKIKKTKKA